MDAQAGTDNRFGEIAVNLNLISQEKLNRALVIQKMIFSRTKVHMAIGKVLEEMGALTHEQIKTVLDTQKYISNEEPAEKPNQPGKTEPKSEPALQGLKLIVSEDKLSAYLCPSDVQPSGLTLEAVKDYLTAQGIDYGIVDDQVLSEYIGMSPLPGEPFKVAAGAAPLEGRPAEIIYHFDTDPLRIGTLKSDGTMDWKDRGEIPHAKTGDLLAEKIPGKPGLAGTDIYGHAIQPPRLRDPRLKSGKGVQRSEDGSQVLAKIDGTPKISSDGKIFVFNILTIKGDIGVETGNVDFDGYVETDGTVTAGYSVKAKGLRTVGIQDAVIEVDEDLICEGGIYGSTIKVGGNMKGSHIHSSTIELMGDLVVEKELFDSNVQSNNRCLITQGKVLASSIDAKKGIEAYEIGSPASKPCRLTVGIDRKHEREVAACEAEIEAYKEQAARMTAELPEYKAELAPIETKISVLVNQMKSFELQKTQFKLQLEGKGPNPVKDDEERFMLEEMISELDEKNGEISGVLGAMREKAKPIRAKIEAVEKSPAMLEEQIAQCQEKITLLDEYLKADPGIPVIKASGTIFNRTRIIGPHKEMILQEDMAKVRVAEAKEDPNSNKYKIKISSLF